MVPAEVREVHGDRRIRRRPEVDEGLVPAILDAQPIREIHSNRRCRVLEVDVAGERFARKEYRPQRFQALRPSPARRSWRVLLEGARRELPLPVPIACSEEPNGAATLLTRWFDGDHIHLVHARERHGRLASAAQRRQFAEVIADTVVTLLRGGVMTGDLAPQNVLVGWEGDALHACLVDLDDVRFVERVPAAQVLENLAQLGHLPPTVAVRDRLRGLHRFLAAGGRRELGPWLDPRDDRALLRELSRRIETLKEEKQARLIARGAADHPYAGWGLDTSGNPIR